MSPHEAYCQFLLAIEVGHITKIFINGCEGMCNGCPARQACTHISDLSDLSELSWVDKARDFFSSVDQDLPLSHYREHHPEYFL